MPRTRRFSGRPNTVAGLLLELVRGVVQRSSARRVNAKAAPPPRERRRLSTRTRHRTAAVALLLALSGIGLARRLWAPSEATAPATRPEAAEEDRRAGVPPLRLQPNGAHLFRTSNGYLAFFQSRPDVYSLVDLDSRGRARAPSRKIQVTDTAAVARIGERFILAFGRDRNRNDDAEPDMDDLSVWTFSPGSGELRETFLLPKQNVLRHAGPRILVNADKTFSVLWGTYGGIVHSLSFDAKGEKVGDRRSSASYGYACSMFETSPFGGGHIGVLAVRKGLSEPDALLLLPGLSGANLPPAKVLLDDVGRRSEQVLLASAEEGSAGLVWQSESGNRLWFGRVNEGGFVGAPTLVHAPNTGTYIKMFAANERGFTLLWAERFEGLRSVTFTKTGKMVGQPRPVEGLLLGDPSVVWDKGEWVFAYSTPSDDRCSLHFGRLTESADKILEDQCAF